MVFDGWWTDESGTTDSGIYGARAFLGKHEVRLSIDGGDFQMSVSVDDPTEHVISILIVDIDVRESISDRASSTVPVAVSGGDEFLLENLDLDTVRFSAPEAVNGGEGSTVRERGSGDQEARRNETRILHFDADESALDGTAMLRGRTEDGEIVVGFNQ